MLLSYRILFSIELLHEYFNKDIFSDCSLVPSVETQQYIGDTLLQRFFTNRLYVLMKEDKGKPYSALDVNRVFRFYLRSNNANLFNYSNIDLRVGKGQFLYFSNLTNNKSGSDLNLSASIPDYSGVTTYQVGDFAKDPASENIFESINQGSGNPLVDMNSWLLRGTTRFVSSADVIMQSVNVFRNTFASPIKKVQTTVKGFKVSGSTLVEYDVFTTNEAFLNPVTDTAVDLSQLSYGKYKIVMLGTTMADVVLNQEVTIYFDLDAQQHGIIGVIEIFSHLDPANDYSLLDNTGLIKEIKYSIRFANKNAIWKYIAQSDNVNDIVTGVAGLSFAKSSKIFTSNRPIQLKQIPDSSFVLEFSNSSPPVKASYPSPSVMKCEKNIDGTIKNYFTEIYINY